MTGYTKNFNYKDLAVTAGTPVLVNDVPPGTTVGVNPGAGGTMDVKYRVTPNGPLLDWTPGSAAAATSFTFTGALAQLVISATTADGTAQVAMYA